MWNTQKKQKSEETPSSSQGYKPSREYYESSEEHYHTSGLSLIAIGGAIMIMAVTMYLIQREDTQYDHISNILVASLIIVTGFWLKSHKDEDLE